VNAEQVARNDAVYREANERIERAAQEYEVAGAIPFICECADPECRAIVRLTLPEYEEIRAHPTQFFNLPGHDQPSADHHRIVKTTPAHVVVEKIGRAGELVNELDPRHARHG
jgi:hypothetical protein